MSGDRPEPPPYNPDYELIGYIEQAQDDAWEIEARRKASRLRDAQISATFRTRNTRTGVRTDPLPGAQHLASRIEVGWEVYSATRAVIDVDRPAGGVVVDIAAGRTADPDTGELADVTRYRTYHPEPGLSEETRWGWVDHADIDPNSVTPPNRATLWWLVGRLGWPSKHRWPQPDELDRLDLAARLARVLW